MSFQTRITELFGIRHPIIAGGLHWLADPNYVAAAAHAGIIGFLTAASFPDDTQLRDAVRRTRDLSQGKFGINVSMLPKLVEGDRTQAVMDLIVAEQVPFVETSGRNPQPYLAALQQSGAKVIHKVPSVRHAVKAQSIGVDAVSVVGAECGGHPGMDMIGSMVQIALAAQRIAIPLAVGGGIGNGAQLAAALAMGADAAVIGTRFLVAEEIWAAEGYKQKLLQADENSTVLVLQSLRNTARVLANETTKTVAQLEAQGADIDTLMPHIAGKIGRIAYETGDCSRGLLSAGQSAVFADAIQPLADIVADMVAQAGRAADRLAGLRRP